MRAEPSCGMQMLSQLGHIPSKTKRWLLYLIPARWAIQLLLFLFYSACTIVWWYLDRNVKILFNLWQHVTRKYRLVYTSCISINRPSLTNPPITATRTSTLGAQLCFHSALAPPHKWSLCFACSCHSPQTGMFERRAAAFGRGPSAAAGLLSRRRRNAARDFTLVPNRSWSSKGRLVKRRDLRMAAAIDDSGSDYAVHPLDFIEITQLEDYCRLHSIAW